MSNAKCRVPAGVRAVVVASAIVLIPPASVVAAAPTPSFAVTEQGRAVGDPTDACLAYATCYWTYSGTASGPPFPTPVRVSGTIYGGTIFDSLSACFPEATGAFQFLDRADHLLLEKTLRGEYCVTRPIGSHLQHTFTGTYTITGGSGRYAGASGSGTTILHDHLGTQSFDAIEAGTFSFRRPPASD